MAHANGTALLHRVLLYDSGVEIPEDHDVHHRNGNRLDNRLENLEVIARAEHARQHARERGHITNQFGTWPLRREVAA